MPSIAQTSTTSLPDILLDYTSDDCMCESTLRRLIVDGEHVADICTDCGNVDMATDDYVVTFGPASELIVADVIGVFQPVTKETGMVAAS